MKKEPIYKPIKKTITATKLRETLFTTLYNVQSTNETVVVQKGGVPVAYIVSPDTYKYSDFDKKKIAEDAELHKILDETKGILSYDPAYEKEEKSRRKKELSAAKRRYNAW